MVRGDCFSNHPILNGTSGVGNVTNIGGVNCYVTGCSLSAIAILLISDVYGILSFCCLITLLQTFLLFAYIIL